MSHSRTTPARVARLWWLTFLTCCAIAISPVIPAFGEEALDPSEADDVVLVVSPTDETGDDDAEEPDESIPTEENMDAEAIEESEQEGVDEATLPEESGDTPDASDIESQEPAEDTTTDPVDDGKVDDGDVPASDESDVTAGDDIDVTAGDDSEIAEDDATLDENDSSSEGDGAPALEEEGDLPAEGPIQESQEMTSVVESGPDTTLQLMSVEDAGFEGDAATALETLEDSGDVSTMASAIVPVYDTPENVVAVLVGSGVTYSNVGYTGATVALGTFTGGDGIIGFEDGIVLGSGDIAEVIGPNDDSGAGTSNNQPGDEALSTLAADQTYDAAVLTFDFVPSGNQIVFSYVFSSEEYNEYVNAGYNDVFAFYVNGENCALVDGGAVSIDTINNDTNSELYVDNEDGHLNTQMDGLTVVLTCQANVTPGTTNTMNLAIADSGDSILDSNVFIQAKSFVVPTPTPSETPVTPSPTTTPDSTATQVPETPSPTSHAEQPHKPHKHFTSYKQYEDECEDPVPAVAFAVTSSSGTGGGVSALPNTGVGADNASANHVLLIVAAMGAGISLVGAIRTSRGAHVV